MIKPYVKTDPTSFYSYEAFEAALFGDDTTSLSLLNYMSQRMDNVSDQLDGTIASTNDGQGNASSAKGGMNGGGPGDGAVSAVGGQAGGQGQDGATKDQRPGANAQENSAIDANAPTVENALVDGNTPPEMTDNMGGGPDLAANGLATSTAETQMDTMSTTDMIINFTLLIVSIITMMIFSHILRKKAF